MRRSRPPATADKVRQVRLVVAVASAVLAVGLVVTATGGHGVWVDGIVGWVAVVVAAGAGAGTETLAAALRAPAGLRRHPPAASPPGRAAGSAAPARRDPTVGSGGVEAAGAAPAGAVDPRLADAVRAVLADAAGCGTPVPSVGPGPLPTTGPAAWLGWADGPGRAVTVRAGDSPAEQLADVAEQVQAELAERAAGFAAPAAWPDCPRHPGAHALAAGVRRRRAVWVCPRADVVVAEIGRLGGS